MKGRDFLGGRVARLPARGTLLFATDLQGNLGDYERLKEIYASEEEAGAEPILLFCGDLVHGPDESLADPERWPDYLGSHYVDRSAELILDFADELERARVFSLLGNHEHAHVGGPVVSKFHADEAAVLDETLGDEAPRIRALFEQLPLLAVAPCGAVLTHGAPRATEPDLESFERLRYAGYEKYSLFEMYGVDTLGALLWARGASAEQARELLTAVSTTESPATFVAYGHDVVHEGYEKVGDEQICLSTSYGLRDRDKVYLRLDLARHYDSIADLREGREILPLYPALA